MKTFTELYLQRISEALIDRAMKKGKWMTQAEVERHHMVPYRDGVLFVRRHEEAHGKTTWQVSWKGTIGHEQYVSENGKRAVAVFERLRREVDQRYLCHEQMVNAGKAKAQS